MDLVGALAQRGEDYAAPDLKPRPVGRVHEAAIFLSKYALRAVPKSTPRGAATGCRCRCFFKPCPERAMLLIAPSISTWRRPPKTFLKPA